MPGMLQVQVTSLHVHVERSFAAAGLDAGDAFHLGRRFEVLVVLRLVDEDMVHTDLVEDDPVILLILSQQLLQLFLPARFLLLDSLDEVAMDTGSTGVPTSAEEPLIFLNLLIQKLLLVRA